MPRPHRNGWHENAWFPLGIGCALTYPPTEIRWCPKHQTGESRTMRTLKPASSAPEPRQPEPDLPF